MNESPLKISSLVKRYGQLKAVDDVSFELKKGEIFGLLGPNGAGKTSLISCIVTLEKKDSGSIEVFGKRISENPLDIKSQIGFVPQELIHHGYFTVFEILRFYSGYFGIVNNEERIQYLLKRLELFPQKDRKVKQLSGGMRRRLLIAKALLNRPRLLLLDEPTAGVDIELRNSLWNLVREIKEEGVSVLLTTHYLEEAENLCDRVAILDKGVLKEIGPTEQIVKKLTQRQIHLQFKKEVFLKSEYLQKDEGKKKIFSIPYSVSLGNFLSQMDLKELDDIHIKEGSLEKAFQEVLKRGG